MCSSKIDHDAGVVTVTTPGAVLEVGHRLFVLGGIAHERAIERDIRRFSFATWAARLGLPASANAAVVPDPARMAQAREMGLVHPSLASEPGSPDQLAA